MPDLVKGETGRPPTDDRGQPLQRRWREIRTGEHAPEVAVAVAPAPISSYAEVAAVAASAWTTIASRAVPVGGPAEDVEAVACDIASILDVGMRFRVQVDAATVWQETVGTRANSATYPRLRAQPGSTVTVQAFHGEATAQTIAASLVTRPVT